MIETSKLFLHHNLDSTRSRTSESCTTMSQSLPLNPYRINTPSREHNAYATCLAYEAEAIAGSHSVISGIQPVTLARVLGYLILHAPTELGRANISNDVTSCGTRENLAEMARLYVTTFICYCECFTFHLLHPYPFSPLFCRS